MSKKRKQYYAVRNGREPGIYLTWEECKAQVDGYAKAQYKGFGSLEEAEEYMGYVRAARPSGAKPSTNKTSSPKPSNPPGAPKKRRGTGRSEDETRAIEMLETGDGLKHVVIYTDGACLGNPGPGGYGVVLLHGKQRKEFSRGFRLTTNNRMEILACIVGLRALKEPSAVTLYSDSQYVINSMTKGWARRWKKNNWKRGDEDVRNPDLWQQMLDLCDKHKVRFNWVRGHAGNKENERCDQLAREAALGFDMAVDSVYENKL
ncbi:MAG TPA: ribonuclease HI [Blastocatellia bacterium]|nr:ribonuclease HI [Blastocatellia bacterium]HKE03025.1 ribonuclease HI [Blastocatellia bacterium]